MFRPARASKRVVLRGEAGLVIAAADIHGDRPAVRGRVAGFVTGAA